MSQTTAITTPNAFSNNYALVDWVKPNELSAYALFHFSFIGYSFKEKATGKIRTKLQVFLKDKAMALGMAQTKTIHENYILVDSIGWRDGINTNR